MVCTANVSSCLALIGLVLSSRVFSGLILCYNVLPSLVLFCLAVCFGGLILCYNVSPLLVLFCFAVFFFLFWSYFMIRCLAAPGLVLSCVFDIVYCLMLPCLAAPPCASPCPGLFCLPVFCLVLTLPCLVALCLALFWLVLSSRVLACVISYDTMSCRLVPRFVLACPVLSCCVFSGLITCYNGLPRPLCTALSILFLCRLAVFCLVLE